MRNHKLLQFPGSSRNLNAPMFEVEKKVMDPLEKDENSEMRAVENNFNGLRLLVNLESFYSNDTMNDN